MTAEEREEHEAENARRKRRREEEKERAAEAKKKQQNFSFQSTAEDRERLLEKHRDEMVFVNWRYTISLKPIDYKIYSK